MISNRLTDKTVLYEYTAQFLLTQLIKLKTFVRLNVTTNQEEGEFVMKQ